MSRGGDRIRIGIMTGQNPNLLVGMLGVLKAGCSFVPVPPDYPDERVDFIIEDCGIEILVTEEEYLEQAERIRARSAVLKQIICVDAVDDRRSSQHDGGGTAKHVPRDPDDLCYVIYTSGSTGKPKGVPITHRNLAPLLSWSSEYFGFGESTRTLQNLSYAFDFGVMEILTTILFGGTLYFLDKFKLTNLSEYVDFILSQKINTINTTPSFFRGIASVGQELSSLKTLHFGGEELTKKQIDEVYSLVPRDCRVHNGYGPTEATINCAIFGLTADSAEHFAQTGRIPIGRPSANNRLYVLDPHLNPVPIGVPGELHVGGNALSWGYLNRPDLTAEKFIPDPFSDQPGARLYKTGDLVRYLADGNIEFLGRIDDQVKVRGFRIEPGEIEVALAQHRAVRQTLVMVREDVPGDKRLVAYVVARNGTTVEAGELRDYLRRRLPAYMIPSAFVMIDSMPLSPSGKVDRRSLPAPGADPISGARRHVPPRNRLDEILVELWQDLLRVETVGIHDNFFELGGDSLKAAVLANRLQQMLDEIIYVVVLFDTQTIAALSDYLAAHFPAAVARLCGTESPPERKDGKAVPQVHRSTEIDTAKLSEMQRLILGRHNYTRSEEEFLAGIERKNRPAIFVLSAPRSGSTLLRVMMAGHPQLFSPPELALLSFRTLGERKRAFHGRDRGWLEGVHRAIMEIKGCDFGEAREIMARYEDEDLSTHEFYRLLQEWIGQRTLVDKTTLYATEPPTLKRAEAYFEEPVYVHLVRQPAATIQSYIDSNLDQVFGYDLPFSVREKAELFWLLCNRNILQFLEEIPVQRRYFLRFEDLVQDPRGVIEDLCRFLGLDFVPGMLEPYRGDKMTDGVHPASRMVGDPRFHRHRGIEADMATKWQTLPPGDSLCRLSEDLASSLGYRIDSRRDLPTKARLSGPKRIARDGELPLSFAQQRLWFLDRLEPDSPIYNIPAAVRLRGRLNVAALQRSLTEMVRRHESLRTTFSTVEGRATQVIGRPFSVHLPAVDLQSYPPVEREREALRLAEEEVRRPFDLERGPLLRAKLLRLGSDDHILVLSTHHIVADGWSMGIFIREMAALYDAFTKGRPSPLPALPIQYVDFAAWQREWLEGEEMERQLSYWRRQLGDSPPVLELPTDRPRQPVQTFRGARRSFRLPSGLAKGLDHLGREHGATLFMTLLAAFQTLLSRYSGQQDICVGTPIANRNRAETESIIGFFVNTLVLRGDLAGNPSFRELLDRTRKVALEAYAHQDIPFEKLVDALQPARDLSHSPLFQVMFVHQQSEIQSLEIPGLTLQPLEVDTGTAKFDLTLTTVEEDSGLRGEFEYNADLFEPATIDRMIGHFQRLLQEIVEDPDRRIGALPLLEESERRRLLMEWSRSSLELPEGRCVHEWFEGQVTRTPTADAIAFGQTRLTYSELNARANQVARYLRWLGVGPEVLVGLCVERSPEMLIGLLGILKAGGAYLPLDPTYPSARLEYIVQDSGVQVVLTQEHLLAKLPDRAGTVVCLDRDRRKIAGEACENLAGGAGLENLAYVIYTSGSTGTPKGTLITHRGLANYLSWCLYAYPVEKGDGSLVHSPLAFDATVTGIFPPLLVGRTVTLLPESADIEELARSLSRGSFSLVKITPMHLHLLGRSLAGEQASGLTRAFIVGGENLVADQIAFWQEHATDTLLFNEYGPTETVVGCVVYQVPADWSGSGSVPIGKVIPNAQVYVLDAEMQPVPVGVPGELYIGGAGVARGYLGRPGLTAEKFVPDPFSDQPGARLYRSGDLVRYLPDGNIEFLGRLDDQVKIRGYRIELGEVEGVLGQHPSLKEVAVVVREDTPGDRRLVAYCVSGSETQPTVSELREFLRVRLPDYMIPSTFVMMDALPLTPNGKVDRRALPACDGARPELATQFVAPRTHKEETLARIWSEILKVDEVGVHDNFFELGGDSILSIQVIARANQAGLRLTPKQIFQNPTIEGLAAAAVEAPAIHAEQGIVTGPVPLTPIQHWFFDQDLPDPNHWNQSVLLETQRPLQPDVLEQSVRHILIHHDALRMRFRRTEAGWTQVQTDIGDEVPFARIDLSALPEQEQARAIEEKANELQASLDLVEGPLFRVAYFDLGAQRPGRLLIVVHHLVVDGVSWRILMEDIHTTYEQLVTGGSVKLPSKTTSFQYWARRLQQHAQSEKTRSELEYWRDVCRRPAMGLPTDFSAGENTEAASDTISVSLSKEETQALLQEVPAAYNTQITEVLLTALAKAFSRWIGSSRIRLELESHGREPLFDDVDLSRTVGWFTTLFPVHLDLTGAATPGDALTSVKEQLRQIPNHGIGYGLLRYLCEESAVRESLRTIPDSEVSFNYLGRFDQFLPGQASPYALARESHGAERSARGRRKHVLDVTASVVQGTLMVRWSYSTNLHRRQTISALASGFLEELRSLIAHCQSPDAGGYTPSDFSDVELSQEEIEELISELDENLEDD